MASKTGLDFTPDVSLDDRPSPTPDPRPPTPPYRAWLLRILGTLFFIALLVWLDLRGVLPVEDIFATLGKANPWLVALSIALYVPFLVVKAARWRMICSDMNMPLRWGDAWRIYSVGLAAGTFTPGQVGDLLKAWYLQRAGYPLPRGLGSSILDRLFDVAGLAVLGLLGVAIYGGRFAGQTPALIILTLACLGVGVFFSVSRTRAWAVNFVMKRLPGIGDRGSGIGGRGSGIGGRKAVGAPLVGALFGAHYCAGNVGALLAAPS